MKALHKTIRKIGEDIENFSFNTSVSAFMICVNELGDLDCHSRQVLEPLVALICPFAPHIAEEIWEALGMKGSACDAAFPTFDPAYLVEASFEYPVSFNGKMRFKKELSLSLSEEEVKKELLADDMTQKYLAGGTPKKIVFVKGKIINIVI